MSLNFGFFLRLSKLWIVLVWDCLCGMSYWKYTALNWVNQPWKGSRYYNAWTCKSWLGDKKFILWHKYNRGCLTGILTNIASNSIAHPKGAGYIDILSIIQILHLWAIELRWIVMNLVDNSHGGGEGRSPMSTKKIHNSLEVCLMKKNPRGLKVVSVRVPL